VSLVFQSIISFLYWYSAGDEVTCAGENNVSTLDAGAYPSSQVELQNIDNQRGKFGKQFLTLDRYSVVQTIAPIDFVCL
jgi:hypothetical protein